MKDIWKLGNKQMDFGIWICNKGLYSEILEESIKDEQN